MGRPRKRKSVYPEGLPDRPTEAVVAVTAVGGWSSGRYEVGVVYHGRDSGAVPDEWLSVDRARWAKTGHAWPPKRGQRITVSPPAVCGA